MDSANARKKYKILMLDDERVILLTIAGVLRNAPYNLVMCNNVSEAMEQFKQGGFDCIISDIIMDDIDGFEFRGLIRKYNARIPFIFLSAMVNDINNSLINNIMSDNFSFYLNKKFSRDDLLRKLEQVIEPYRAQAEMQQLRKSLENQLEMAKKVQIAILPPIFQIKNNYITSYIYKPKFQVSGDFFESIPLNKNKCIWVLGDISGHGIHSALIMSAIISVIKETVQTKKEYHTKPELILKDLNQFFRTKFKVNHYMTCMIAIWDFEQKVLLYHNAGCPDILCFNNKTLEKTDMNPDHLGSVPIGMFDDAVYSAKDNIKYHFCDDDVFFALSDGIYDLSQSEEAQNEENDDYIEESFLETTLKATLGNNSIPQIPYQFWDILQKSGYHSQIDDCTMVLMTRNPYKLNPNHLYRQIYPTAIDVDTAAMEIGEYVRKQFSSDIMAEKTELLLCEFLNNIISHSEAKDLDGHFDSVALYLKGKPTRIEIRVWDFNPNWKNINFKSHNHEELDRLFDKLNSNGAPNGRGVPLIMKLSSNVRRNFYDQLNETIFTIDTKKIE